MLKELLDTRVMVKHAMKGVKSDKVSFCRLPRRHCTERLSQALRRVLDARQLSLKYICNVTYGYTSATFSGRMPAVEIADSIVQSGRETLEKVRRDELSRPLHRITIFRPSGSSKPHRSGVRRSCTETQTLYSFIWLGKPRIRRSVSDTTSQTQLLS
jgi:hypothetical protein